jgi:hypothetical protein
MKLMLMAANDNLSARLFGVSRTPFSSGFVPRSERMMTDDFITADSGTAAFRKLYRFHYNLRSTVPVNWPVVKHSSSPQITGKEGLKLFRCLNNWSEDFCLTF